MAHATSTGTTYRQSFQQGYDRGYREGRYR